jgi:hypothetical protein
VDFHSIAKKLKFEIMHQHHARPCFGFLATLTDMKTSGSTTKHNTPVRKELSKQKELCQQLFLFTFIVYKSF